MEGFRAITVLFLCCAIGVQGNTCPTDSVETDGGCKCLSTCAPSKCGPGEHAVEIRAAVPDTPGRCCALYRCDKTLASISYVSPEDTQPPGSCKDSSGTQRNAGEHWKPEPCTSCSCVDSNISCQSTMCKTCDNPIPAASGECCAHCPSQNTTVDLPVRCEPLKNCGLQCELAFDQDENGCPLCECVEQVIPPKYPVEKICPELPHCTLNCTLKVDEGDCQVCACLDPNPDAGLVLPPEIEKEKSDKIVCPALSCDLHCVSGLATDENRCTVCECNTKAGCKKVTCQKDCPHGYKTNKRGCQTCRCRAPCVDYMNVTHPQGSSWNPDSCTSCDCDQEGRLNCQKTICSVACSNPLDPVPGTCCPECPTMANNDIEKAHPGILRGLGVVHLTVTAVLAVLCVALLLHIACGRFRGRLAPSEASYSSYPPQYYKCVPAYDTPVHQNEKIIPL